MWSILGHLLKKVYQLCLFAGDIQRMTEHVNVYVWRVDLAPIKQEELKAFGILLFHLNVSLMGVERILGTKFHPSKNARS